MGFPGTSGATSAIIARKSIDFDGFERMQFTSNTDITIGNQWSISIWFDPDTVTSQETPFMIQNSGNSINLIQMLKTAAGAMTVQLNNSAGTGFKVLTYTGGAGTVGVWQNIVLTFDGTDTGDPMVFYQNGSTVAGTGTDNTGTMTSTTRIVYLASNSGGTDGFNGHIAHITFWDTVLDQNDVDEVWGQKLEFDPTRTSGTYDKAANAVHWWKLGEATGTPRGQDYIGSADFDSFTNIDDADISTNIPT